MKTIELIGIDYGIFREYNEENEQLKKRIIFKLIEEESKIYD